MILAKNILLIQGSPRRGGNTEALAQAFCQGAQATGNQVTIFDAAHKHIGGCLDCGACHKLGHCVQQDGMTELYPLLERADVLVFATPVFFWGASAQLKLVIDRLYALGNHPNGFGKKETILLSVAEGEDEHSSGFCFLKGQYQALTDYIGWTDRGILFVPGVLNKGDIDRHPTALAQARALGELIGGERK